MINKDLLDVIKCEMDNEQLVVKSHVENFNAKSQLIVNESQEALFYKDGQALDLFPSGRHSLNSDNLPIFKRIFASLFGGKTPFTCEVFYINKVTVLDLAWGTSSPIPIKDPKYGFVIKVKAFGQTGIRVKDSRKFVVKVVGQLHEYTVSSVSKAIRGVMNAFIKESIAEAAVSKKISLLEISAHLTELSDLILEKLNTRVQEHGLELEQFYIENIELDEQDLQRLSDAHAESEAEAYKLERLSKARALAREVEGYTYQEERKYDVLGAAASNSGTGGTLINAGLGLGVGLGVMNEVGKVTGSAMSGQPEAPAQQAQAGVKSCANCGAQVPMNAKFCPECGTQMPVARFCQECGEKLAPGAKFCPNCGTKA